MLSAKFDPSSFFRTTEHVALHVAAEEVFSLLSRTLDLPPAWAALVKRKTGELMVVSPGGRIDGTNAEDVLFVRSTPIDVSQAVDGLLSSDRLECRADLRLLVTLYPERSELVSFGRSILGSRRVAKAETIAAYVQPGVRAALAQFAAEHSAEQLVDGAFHEEAAVRLQTALAGPCFTAGLSMESKARVQFVSEPLAQARQAEADASRRRAEQEARHQSQSQHLEHVTTVLDRLRALSTATPDVPLADLIRTFSEQQRGDVYQALFANDVSSVRTQWIVVATADEVLFFDPAHTQHPARRLRVDGPAGPARSVQTSVMDTRPVLLIGAASGVYRWPIDRAEPDLVFLVPDAPPVRGGFNAVAQVGEHVFASHSELGLRRWDVSTAAARRLFVSFLAGAKVIRELKPLHSELYCCVDNRVLHWRADQDSENPVEVFAGSAYTLTALCPSSSGVYAGNSEGEVLHWPGGNHARPVVLHRGAGRPVESLWSLSSQGVDRLFFTDTSLQVHSRVLGDNFLCRYEAGGQTIRRVEVASDLLVGVNDTRDRLFCWSTGEPNRPSSLIPIHRLVGQSVQDVCLVPAS